MGFVKIFGWVFLISGMMTMASPVISSTTGFAVANLNIGLAFPSISFSMTAFVVGGLLSFVGLVIVRPEKKSVIERL